MNVGVGLHTASIPLMVWDTWYKAEYPRVEILAESIEELDYLQLAWSNPSCPSTKEALKESAEAHIQPIINRIFNARIGLSSQILNQDLNAFDEVNLDDYDPDASFSLDVYNDRSLFNKVQAVEKLADSELNGIQAFLADIENLARLRYPDLDSRDKNIRDLALSIDDSQVDGQTTITYIVGARANLIARFENIIKLLENAAVRYNVEIKADEIIDLGKLNTWFPEVAGESWADNLDKLIRWSECWLSGLLPALAALQAIQPVPVPQPGKPAIKGHQVVVKEVKEAAKEVVKQYSVFGEEFTPVQLSLLYYHVTNRAFGPFPPPSLDNRITKTHESTVAASPNLTRTATAGDACPAVPPALSEPPLAPLVDHPQIARATLHNPLPLYLKFYVWPFFFLYPLFGAIYFPQETYDKYIHGSEFTFLYLGGIVCLQTLLWLSCQWNVNIKTLFTTRAASDVFSAKLIKVIPVENSGKSEICEIIHDKSGPSEDLFFLFQKRRFLFLLDIGSFAPLVYPLSTIPKPKLETFQHSLGIQSATELTHLKHHYGPNTFDIPVPTFTELFKEHSVAPFFVFQIFCVGLWCLDEYWYYSIFTLFMLVAFESTVVWQRQRTLTEFRGMSIKPYPIFAHRLGQWVEVQSDELLPGDLVSVGRTKEDSGVACDMVLIEGTAIVNEAMLSGESTPLLKDSVALRPGDAHIEPEGFDKNAILYGGTKVLQVTHAAGGEENPETNVKVSLAPDNGALAVVTKTGFETSQGQLVRTMIYSTEPVSANNMEALLFILFLLMFAIAASWYVWTEGVLQDRKRSKLLLDCVLIITSVVPPELPMELSLAVNTSLAALSRYAIYCTEPFRIPFAGRVDVCCFDKTGTLTGEDLVVEGVAGLPVESNLFNGSTQNYPPTLQKVSDVGSETTLVLATAHALVRLDEGEIVGDPMEKATLEALQWSLGRNDTLTSNKVSSLPGKAYSQTSSIVTIRRRFQFSSALKRQSSVATMIVSVPPDYEATFKYYTRRGSRVLALGYKYLSTDGELGSNRVNNLTREDVESELIFAGFLVLHTPLKDDAKKTVRMLNESSHRVIMITGDNPLTAVHVAKEVEIVDRECYILDAPEDENSPHELIWRSVDESVIIPVDPVAILDPEILKEKDICVTGYALNKLTENLLAISALLRHTWVYARVSPLQKEIILTGLKALGYTTLMCGDGTNDVGALKQAHVGVALLNGTEQDLVRISEHFKVTKMKEIYEKQVNLTKRFNAPTPPPPVMIAHLFPPGPGNPNFGAAVAHQAKVRGVDPSQIPVPKAPEGQLETVTTPGAAALQAQNPNAQAAANKSAGFADQMTTMMMDQELGEDEPPTIKLGDASVAAPFTSKLANVIAIANIIRQGRCTLVATIQMYKILALNCLISAYSLSVLYLDGIKFGDGQVTISGMMMSVCFLSISRAKPVEKLSRERPQPNIFNPYIIGSVLGQFAVHIVSLVYISNYVKAIEPHERPKDLEKDFQPSLLNSAIYLISLIQQISTFAINYQGRPFRESIRENRAMYWGLVAVGGIAFSCSTEFIPELNEKLRLVKFTDEFKTILTTSMLLDYGCCWVIEKVLKWAFSDYKPKDIAVRRKDQMEREANRAEEVLIKPQTVPGSMKAGPAAAGATASGSKHVDKGGLKRLNR
ncbi:hypothetical protein ABW21_db0208102 [Orbilia brochopaga]|nr:hypothetical protein ABW21_db0208102 [Drechslerella brochopaga]